MKKETIAKVTVNEKEEKTMTNETTTMNLVDTLTAEFPHLTAVNKAKTWNVDFLNKKTHVLGTKYIFKSNTYVLYLPKRTYAAAEEHLTDELKKQFTFHEKWGMPYELKGDLQKMLEVLPALRIALTPKSEKTEEPAPAEEAKPAEKPAKAPRKSGKSGKAQNKSNKS